jgi:intracellular sulfur oxidation DsrE/DsrF family protein
MKKIKNLIFLIVLSMLPVMAAQLSASDSDEEVVRKAVFDLTTGNMKTFEQRILSGVARYTAHYQGMMQEFDAVVVIHGNAFKFFVKDLANSPYKDQKELVKANKDLKIRIAAASDIYEVEFLMCEANMLKEKLTQEDIYPFVKIVPSSSMGLIEKQNEGYAYIPVH